MKYVIEIPKPCTENWEQMTPSEKGRFCASCQKEVVDFTHFSDSELAKYVHTHNNLCGRLLLSQLDKQVILPKTKTRFPFRLYLGISSLIAGVPALAQENKTKIENIDQIKISATKYRTNYIEITGVVLDEIGALPGATIREKNSGNETSSDVDGVFKIQIPYENFQNKVLLQVMFIGLDTTEVEVSKDSKDLKVMMKAGESSFVGGMVVAGGIHTRKQTIFRRFINLFRKDSGR